jgi:hypothetical protein
VDEQSGSLAEFNVVPNPNKGQMTFFLEKFSGKVELKMYDMTGTLVDQFSTYSDGESKTLPYNIGQRADGIYFIVATGKEGTVTKKVVIAR